MDYSYEIMSIDEEEHWIFINHEDWFEPDAFVALVKKIRDDCQGTIVDLGMTQYKIEGDGLGLIYQYDDLFGTVVIYKKDADKDATVEFLKRYFCTF